MRLPFQTEDFTAERLIELTKQYFEGEDIIDEGGHLLTVAVTRSFGRFLYTDSKCASLQKRLFHIGDFGTKKNKFMKIVNEVILSEPEFTTIKLDKRSHILALGSDGIPPYA